MNKYNSDILISLYKYNFDNQRTLADSCKCSLGMVNKSLKELKQNDYIDENMNLTNKSIALFNNSRPQNAIILAAGYGMRMVPINTIQPKGLLEVQGETLIERIINQLHAVGVTEILIVVGFMKEKYEFLIDKYNVKLIVNNQYFQKNNLFSLNCAKSYITNSYIIPCDIWCNNNPFNEYELYPWYMVSDIIDDNSEVRVNRAMELVKVSDNSAGNTMIGISYISNDIADTLKDNISTLCKNNKHNNSFWETALYDNGKMLTQAKVVYSEDVVEINSYEQLRDLDNSSNSLSTLAIETISNTLNISPDEISQIEVLKKGMTNRSFTFVAKNKKYIMRIPGEGTEKLINRKNEATVYDTIKNLNLCDNTVYINSDNGYKITEFVENARVCNPQDNEDLKKCMEKLRTFHQLNLTVEHEFNVFAQIDYYESLWDGKKSIYSDYSKTKEQVLSLKDYVSSIQKEYVLCHIDAVPDNFLITNNNIQLIDWEYAGMQDPHVDIAMFVVYSLYNSKEQVDNLIDIYFEGKCTMENRIKIYCYISMCGLLWSNWCEYKSHLGIDFGEYSLAQYRYAKEYYRIATSLIDKNISKEVDNHELYCG